MAIPSSFESEQLKAVREYYLTLDLSDLQPLQYEDMFLVGAFVQTFNFIEFNLRRIIEVFCEAKLIARKKYFQPSELVKQVKAGAGQLALSEPQLQEVLGKLDEIEFRRSVRNLLAHWSAKRVPGHDAIVLLSMDAKDSVSALGEPAVTKNEAIYALMMLPDLRGLLKHISAYDLWLARTTAEWHGRYGG